jgi:hypothetical protein
MNGSRFDDISRRFSRVDGLRQSRRDVLKIGAAGLAAAIGVTERSGATPPLHCRLERLPLLQASSDRLKIEQLAFDLEYDTERMFRFVADEIHYDAYAGALRGATGTLWGLAGNSVDQALLLAALLDQALVRYRFATGELDTRARSALLDAADLDETSVRARATAAIVSGPDVAVPSRPLNDEEDALLTDLPALGDEIVTSGRLALAQHTRVIMEALGDQGVSLPTPSTDLPELESRQHTWLQIRQGSRWVDLDPTVRGADVGVALTNSAGTMDELPDVVYHRVKFRLVAEVVTGGAPSRVEQVSHEARTPDLVGIPITAMNSRPEALEALGSTISGIVDGKRQYVPYLIVGDQVTRGATFGFVSADGVGNEAFDQEIAREGDTLGQWLQVDISAPDGSVSRSSAKSSTGVGVAARAASKVGVVAVPPIQLTESEPGQEAVFLPAHRMLSIAVAGNTVPLGHFMPTSDTPEFFRVMAFPAFGAHLMRDVLTVEALAPLGARAYQDGPNVTAVFAQPKAWNGEGRTMTVGLDILHRSLQTVPLGDATPSLDPRVASGVLSAVAERLSFAGDVPTAAPQSASTPGPDESARSVGTSVLSVFEEAIRGGVAITALLPDDGPYSPNPAYSAEANARIATALAAGLIVVIPAAAVSLGGAPVVGWWTVDPTTGRAVDVFESGQGLQTAAEEIVLTEKDIKSVHFYKRVGCHLAGLYILSAVLIGAGTWVNTQRAERPA